MNLDPISFGLGLSIAAAIAYAYQLGQQHAIRLARRIWRHRGNLDQVFFEDAERDVTIEPPKPVKADVNPLRGAIQ